MDTVDERVTILTSAVCARSLSRAGDAQNMTGLSNQAARATTLTSTRSSSSATHARPRAIGDHRERRSDAVGNRCGCQALVDAQSADDVTREQEFSREEVHLDLSPLSAAIANNAINADRRRLGGPHRIGLTQDFVARVVP